MKGFNVSLWLSAWYFPAVLGNYSAHLSFYYQSSSLSSSFSSPNKPQTRRAANIKSPHSRHLQSVSEWCQILTEQKCGSDSADSEHHWYHYSNETDESVLTDWLAALEVNYDRCRGARDNLDILWSTNDPGQAGMKGDLTPRLLQSSWTQQDETSLATAELFLT